MLATSPPEVGAVLPTPVPTLGMGSVNDGAPRGHALVGTPMGTRSGGARTADGESGVGRSTLLEIPPRAPPPRPG